MGVGIDPARRFHHPAPITRPGLGWHPLLSGQEVANRAANAMPTSPPMSGLMDQGTAAVKKALEQLTEAGTST